MVSTPRMREGHKGEGGLLKSKDPLSPAPNTLMQGLVESAEVLKLQLIPDPHPPSPGGDAQVLS